MKSKKKILIKIDKPIEVGDLVRCVEDNLWFEAGDIRKVHSVSGNQISVVGEASCKINALNWEPVRKLKAGDLVRSGWSGLTYTACEIYASTNNFTVEGELYLFVDSDNFELLQPEKHDPKQAQRREFMRSQVAEMVVELLDKADLDDLGSLVIGSYRKFNNKTYNTIYVNSVDSERHVAKLHPDDVWDTLTGVFVALSKATGRKLPDWIYGEEKE